MTYLQALLLGLIQGLTEFFPVSSSAHLKLAKLFLGTEGDLVVFDLFCHFGTLVALVYFFRRDILQASFINRDGKKVISSATEAKPDQSGAVRASGVNSEAIAPQARIDMSKPQQAGFHLFTAPVNKQIFFALLPLVPFYFLLKPLREAASDIHFLGYFMILTSLILFIGQRFQLSRTASPIKDAMMIGSMQAVALIPGISRSASTISTARTLGWGAKEAVRFSFLLSIPTIMAGTLVESAKMIAHPPESFSFGPCFVGFFASLSLGLLIVPKAMRFLEKGNLKPFAWYCLLAGILVTLIIR